MIYLQKPLSIAQGNHVLKFLTVVADLQLISESTFADTAIYLDDFLYDIKRLSWEAPPSEWFDK